MDIKEQFNEDLRGGRQIEGMLRNNGYFLGHNDDGTQEILFDNGNFYIIKDGNVVKRIDGTDVYFIDKQIIKAIYSFIDSNPLMSEEYAYTESNYEDVIEFNSQSKKKPERGRGILIRFMINRSEKNIAISNILIPLELQHNSFGKGIINEIFQVAQMHDYQLFLVQLVKSFYDKMVKRGAKIIEPYEAVAITNTTKLN